MKKKQAFYSLTIFEQKYKKKSLKRKNKTNQE